MRALYSLVSRARTVCALGQAAVALARAGPSALASMQLLILGCGFCLVIAMLVPSGHRRATFVDRLCSVMAAAAVIGLAITDIASSCVVLGRLTLGV